MTKILPVTKTPAELDAVFAAVFKDVKGVPKAKPLTKTTRLEAYRKQVGRLRQRGLSWEQIAIGMADPRIGETVSEKMLRLVFGHDGERKKERGGGVASPAKPAAPALRPHVMIDPLTGKTITLPPPA